MAKEEWNQDLSPVEVLRELIVESTKWNERLVRMNQQIMWAGGSIVVLFWYLFSSRLVRFLSGEADVSPFFLLVGVPLAIYTMYAMVVAYRWYTENVARRDRWRRRFEILRNKEGELDRLLSDEEAG